METTFISVHDLSQEAKLLYTSASVVDILGFTPEEVLGRSAFEYFHPEEIPFARSRYGRGVQMDKAAVLSYCRIRNRQGQWVGCECVFTIVYDVLVASTSIYRRGVKSHQRAVEAPIVRRLFASSPRDPRYNMLSHLSMKFSQGFNMHHREPRAALFLNRFTRTLSIMYATQSITDIFGITAEEIKGRSFYYCIQENCLQDAIRCLESAKANDSIAYLRFWFRDPRQEREPSGFEDTDTYSSESSMIIDEDDEEGGVQLVTNMRDASVRDSSLERAEYSDDSNISRLRSVDGKYSDSANAIFDSRMSSKSSNSSPPGSSSNTPPLNKELEIEAVVSCTSDGLVVILRRARTPAPPSGLPPAPVYTNGLFASPWAAEPIIPPPTHPHHSPMLDSYLHQQDQHRRPLRSRHDSPLLGRYSGPPLHDFMASIRDVAAFAWSLTGINGSLIEYGRGTPSGYSQPSELPVWAEDPYASSTRRPIKQEHDDHDRPMTDIPPHPQSTPSPYNNTLVAMPIGSPHHFHPSPGAPQPTSRSYAQQAADQQHHLNFATHYNPQYGEYVPPTAEVAQAHASENGQGQGCANGQIKDVSAEPATAEGYRWF
ncbi:MAG: hypothetical protein M1814_001643 [Vezdaea aestivalis]|nr:MAG: hypothetical protein M1814_001643 [Vezdaea aestivalis]